MIRDIFPFLFEFNRIAIAASCLWSLALYLLFPGIGDWIAAQFLRWLNFADRSLYTTMEEYEETRPTRESQNALYASVVSIVPFLILGALSNWGLDVSLGKSWSISLGSIACIVAAIYTWSRNQNSEQE